MPREFFSPRVPKEMIKTTNTELENAGRDTETFLTLKKKSLAVKELSPERVALILPKLKPYSPRAGFDNMIFIAEQHGVVPDISALPTSEFVRVLRMTQDLQDVYRREAELHGSSISLELIAVNYHANPVEESVFQKKLHAQTLPDLHVHVTSYEKDDLEQLRSLDPHEISKQEWRDVHDPFMNVFQLFLKSDFIRSQLTQNISTIQFTEKGTLPGCNFTCSRDQIASAEVAHDLQQLHKNYLALYKTVTGLFVDASTFDKTGMPVPRPKEMRLQNVETFLEQMKESFSQSEDFQKLKKWLETIGTWMLSGEKIQEKKGNPDEKNIWLRGPAYTVSILEITDQQNAEVNFTPRFFSTGNVLASLGLHKGISGDADPAWILQRKETEEKIRQQFAPENN